MLGQLLMIFLGILSLIGAASFSLSFLNQSATLPQGNTVAQVHVVPSATSTILKNREITPGDITQSTTSAKQTNTVVAVAPPVKVSTVPVSVTATSSVIAPGPLRVTTTTVPANSTDLTIAGVIDDTNTARAQNGNLPALMENFSLDRDAQMKLDDMFAKQYFEHISPTGVGPADLAKMVGYDYVLVGENLALGNFGSDQGVVTAWMNSPGHRANILNLHYQEIGVAVGQGTYEGHVTWIAVQSFGMPLSACPSIDANLKTQIDANNITIANLRAQLDAIKVQIDTTSTYSQNYNTYVNEFNALVPQYNTLVETNRANVSVYNSEVQSFNLCIDSVSSTSTASTTTH